MRNSRHSAVDPFMVMDVIEALRKVAASGRNIIHKEVGQPGTPTAVCVGSWPRVSCFRAGRAAL